MTDLFKRLLLVCFVLALSACAAIIPKEHLIPKDQLVSTTQKQFPLHWEKAGGLLSITINQPQLTLISSQNRISLNGRFIAHAPLIDIDGDFVSSSSLRYDPKQRAIFLQGASLDTLHFKQGNKLGEMLRSEISRILSNYAADHPIYRFKPEELVVLGVKVDVDGIGVVPEGVMLNLRTM